MCLDYNMRCVVKNHVFVFFLPYPNTNDVLTARGLKFHLHVFSRHASFVFAGENHAHYITKTCPCNIQRFFHSCKNDNFQSKAFDYFHIFAQNIDCGYTLEPPQ